VTSYTYTTSDTTTLPRFMIHMVKDFQSSVQNLTCFGTGNGEVLFSGAGISGSSFELLDSLGNSVFIGNAVNDSLLASNLQPGTYDLSTDFSGVCGSNNFTILVEEPMLVTAEFELVQDTVYLNQGGVLQLNNLSSGTNYSWDFGDGNSSIIENPTHTYTVPGVYQVMLTADNDNVGQCSEVTSKNIVVMNGPLSINELTDDNFISAYASSDFIVVKFDFENNIDVIINLIDVNGKNVLNEQATVSNNSINLISKEELSNGIYIVRVQSNGRFTQKKLIVE